MPCIIAWEVTSECGCGENIGIMEPRRKCFAFPLIFCCFLSSSNYNNKTSSNSSSNFNNKTSSSSSSLQLHPPNRSSRSNPNLLCSSLVNLFSSSLVRISYPSSVLDSQVFLSLFEQTVLCNSPLTSIFQKLTTKYDKF